MKTAPAPASAAATLLHLVEECIKNASIKEVADKLNICVGTIRRWLELRDVPIQYTFDIYKLIL
jgi:hypothetical protein